MIVLRVLGLLFLSWGVLGEAQTPIGTWELKKSQLHFEITHPLKTVKGASAAARGKVLCKKNQCEFLVAAPVKSFSTGDGNRDSNIHLKARESYHPLVSARGQFPSSALKSEILMSDVEVLFAGKKKIFSQVKFTFKPQGGQWVLRGDLPCKLSDFAIERPSLLGIPVYDEMPIRLELNWQKI